MKLYRLILSILALALICHVYEADASVAARKKKKKKESTEVVAPKPVNKKKVTPYEKFMKEAIDSACGGFVNMYRSNKDKIYIAFPKSHIGRRLLVGSTVSSTSDPNFIDVGYKYNRPVCLQVEMRDSTVLLYESQVGATTKDSLMQLAMERSYVPKLFARIPVSAYNKDSSSLIFDITALINAMTPKGKDFTVVKQADSKSSYFGKMKSFEDNASIVVNNNIEFSKTVFIAKVKLGEGTISSTVSILLLPEKPMRARVQDSRIGVFSTSGINKMPRVDLSNAEDGFNKYRIANRWRLEPSDMEAWSNGEKVCVRQPIVWYVDNTFPELWRGPIKEGVLAWNRAFEKFGLKNAICVKDFPSSDEDPEFDPDNLKYNCIRYVPNATMNAYGPSWVDPVSGEILNASVIVYNDIIRLINNWRFVQTAQIDERVRSKKMPEEIMAESIRYVVSHEIGHTLGLMHNMGASSAFPVDSLRSPVFTAIYGVTPSIMDYARFNYIAQPGDKGVSLMPPILGIYDEYAIEWLYRPIPQAKDIWEEYAIAERLIDSKSGNPFYRYGPQQIGSSANMLYDPSAMAEDLGDDPIKAGAYGVKNLKYILPNLCDWIEDDEDFSHRKALYAQIAGQYKRYLNNVLAQVGGIYLNNAKYGAGIKPSIPVERHIQRASLKWVIGEIRNSSWLEDKSLTDNIGLRVPYPNKIAEAIGNLMISEVPARVVLSSSLGKTGSTYTLKDYYDDLYRELFLRPAKLSSAEKTLHRTIVKGYTKNFIAMKTKGFAEDDNTCERFYEDAEVCFGESNEPYRRTVDMSSFSENSSYSAYFLSMVRSLAFSLRKSAPLEDRAHYEYLYLMTNNALGDR